jgi:tetratricopeptide (TPR) repeat protein
MTEAKTNSITDAGPETYYHIQLAKNTRFTGRTAILGTLEETLFGPEPNRKVALVGLGGVGKTQVALHFAYQTKEKRPDYSIFWVPTLSEQSIIQAYTEIASKVGLRKSNKDEDIRELIRQHFSSNKAGKWLMIVDNADDQELIFGDAEKPGIEEYLPESEDGLILLTTRSRQVAVDFAGPNVIEVQQMDPVEATYLIEKSLTRKDLIQDEAIITELLNYLTFLPLAITQAAAYLNTTKAPAQKYIELLRGAESNIAKVLGREFRDNTRYRGSRNAVGATWLVSFEQIEKSNPVAVRLLSFISYIEPKAIPQTILPQEEVADLDWAIGTLCSYSFIVHREGSNTFDMHSLVHKAIRGWLEMRGRKDHTVNHGISHLAEIFPSSDRANYALRREYLPHAMRLLDHVNMHKTEHVYLLYEKVADSLESERRFKEAVKYYEEICWWRQGELEETNERRLLSEHELASAYLNNRQITEAISILKRIVEIRKETLDERDHSRLASEHELARAYLDNRQITEAISILKRIVEIRKETLGERDYSRLSSEHELARAYLDNRQIPEAISILERIVKIRKETLDERDHSRLASEHALASAYLDNRQIPEAISILERIVKIRKETLDKRDHSRLASEHALARAYQYSR